MNLRDVDLNLLVILDALLEEAHVSRAAERVGLSQPAASNALNRARTLFKDKLLVRTAEGMRRTPAAERLRGPLREALAWVGHVIVPAPANLKTLRQSVRLVMGDYAASVVTSPLLERLRQSSPGIDLIVEPGSGRGDLDRLRRGEVDLMTLASAPSGDEFEVEEIGYVVAQVVMRKRHPAAAHFGLPQWLEHPHLIVSATGETSDAVDGVLAKVGKSRRVAAVVPNYLLALQIVSETDFFALLPTQMLPARLAGNLAALESPLPVDPTPLFLLRHRRTDGDAAIAHVAGLVRETLAELI